MNLLLYIQGDSFIHKLPAGIKLVAIALISSLAFIVDSFVFNISLLLACLLCYSIARIPLFNVFNAIKSLLFFIGLLFLLQWYYSSLFDAISYFIRLISLILFALLVTFTTTTTEMLNTIEKILSPLKLLGVKTQNISLGISLAIRFIPVLQQVYYEVKEAQHVRGKGRSIIALMIPVLIRVLKMSDQVAEAIDARNIEL